MNFRRETFIGAEGDKAEMPKLSGRSILKGRTLNMRTEGSWDYYILGPLFYVSLNQYMAKLKPERRWVRMKRTPLNQVHQDMGGKMVNFAGWNMPVQYSGIIDEHLAVRNKCGLFDVSHMGEIVFSGPDALKNLQQLVTNNVARLSVGQILYTTVCYPDGGIVDDILVYRLAEEEYLLVVNASNTDKDFSWFTENSSGRVNVENISQSYAQLALQGPESENILQQLTDVDLKEIKYYWFKEGDTAGKKSIISRTGYTGEKGFEIYLKPDDAVPVWNNLFKIGKKYGMIPAGLGARDTLRLEKKFCLYGNEISKDRHPLEAGLGWTVKFDKGDFIGRAKLLEFKENGYPDRLVGFKLHGRGIARHGYKIEVGGEEVGVVTSGSYSPSLEESIGLGYIQKEKAGIGQKVQIIIRKRPVDAEIVETPFI